MEVEMEVEIAPWKHHVYEISSHHLSVSNLPTVN